MANCRRPRDEFSARRAARHRARDEPDRKVLARILDVAIGSIALASAPVARAGCEPARRDEQIALAHRLGREESWVALAHRLRREESWVTDGIVERIKRRAELAPLFHEWLKL